MNRNELLARLAPYRGQERTIVHRQDTGDIMQGMADWHKRYRRQYDAISHYFAGRTDRETARKIFDFLKGNVQYIIENDARQTLKTPAAIIAQGHGDCKHYALFTGGILDSLAHTGIQRIPWAFRYASYRWYDETPQHVFVVLNPGTKNEIWVDPVLSRFDQKKPYSHKIDTPMALVGISGVTRAEIGAVKKERIRKGGKVILKVAAAPARGAFLALVSLNVFQLAVKLNRVWQTKPQDLKNWWAGLGGQINKLTDAVAKGVKRRERRMSGIGEIVSASTAALITAAAPVLTAALGLLKRSDIDTTEIETAANVELNKRTQDAAGEYLTSDVLANEVADNTASELKDASGRRNLIIPVVAGGLLLLLLSRRRR